MEKGANPSARDLFYGHSSLMSAASRGNSDIVKLLLEHGANPFLETHEGFSALHFAKTDEVKEILKEGALIGAAVDIAQHLIVHGLILKKDVTWESIKEVAIEGAIWGAITGGWLH